MTDQESLGLPIAEPSDESAAGFVDIIDLLGRSQDVVGCRESS